MLPTITDDGLDSRFEVARGTTPAKLSLSIRQIVRGLGYAAIFLLVLSIGALAMFPGMSEFASTALFPDAPRVCPSPRSGECCKSLILELPQSIDDESESPESLAELAKE